MLHVCNVSFNDAHKMNERAPIAFVTIFCNIERRVGETFVDIIVAS